MKLKYRKTRRRIPSKLNAFQILLCSRCFRLTRFTYGLTRGNRYNIYPATWFDTVVIPHFQGHGELFYFSIISVKAKSFADREIRYTLKAQGQGAAGTFNIGPTTGIVKLAKELDFEDLRQPHIYSLSVTATEDSGGFSTSVEVNISASLCIRINVIYNPGYL